MTTQLQNLIGEIQQVHEALSLYAEQLGAYIFDPNQPFPEFDETKLVTDELLIKARTNKDSAVDTTSGAISSTVYKAAGVLREISYRSLTKALLYDMASDTNRNASVEIRSDAGQRLAELRSMTPAQNEGQ